MNCSNVQKQIKISLEALKLVMKHWCTVMTPNQTTIVTTEHITTTTQESAPSSKQDKDDAHHFFPGPEGTVQDE
jgi:hypothetical protein